MIHHTPNEATKDDCPLCLLQAQVKREKRAATIPELEFAFRQSVREGKVQPSEAVDMDMDDMLFGIHHRR